MRRAGKVHPPLARRGYANVVVDSVREYCSPANCVASTKSEMLQDRGASRLSGMCGRYLKISAAPEMEELKQVK